MMSITFILIAFLALLLIGGGALVIILLSLSKRKDRD